MRLHSASKTDAYETLSSRPTDDHPEDSIQKIAVLFTDIVGSTKFFKSHGDVVGRQMLQLHQDMASGCIVEHGGVLVKILGDSVMAYFLDPKEALKSAIRIQQRIEIHNRKTDPQDRIHIKIGIHFGDGIVEHSDIFGDVVNTAAKLTSLVDRDQIFISQEVYELVQDLLQRGVPIHGIGLQMHVSIDQSPRPQDVLVNMDRLSELGLEVHITEMDVRIQGNPTENRFARQADEAP